MSIKSLLIPLLYGLFAYAPSSNATIEMWVTSENIKVVNREYVIVRDEVEQRLGYILDRPFQAQPGYEYHLFVDTNRGSWRSKNIGGIPYVTINAHVAAVLESRPITELDETLQIETASALPAMVNSAASLPYELDHMRMMLEVGGNNGLRRYNPEQIRRMRIMVLEAMLALKVPQISGQLNEPRIEPALAEWAAASAELWDQTKGPPGRPEKIIDVTANRLSAARMTKECAMALTAKRNDFGRPAMEKAAITRFHNSIDNLRALLPELRLIGR